MKDNQIGATLRMFRLQRELTLRQVSEQTGMSIGMLSQVERGLSTLDVRGLEALAALYGVDASTFFQQGGGDEVYVVRDHERLYLQHSSNYAGHVLCREPKGRSLVPYRYDLYPDTTEGESFVHRSEEFIYVLEGRVVYIVDGEHYELHPGDMIYVPGGVPHAWRNETGRTARLLAFINYQPGTAAEKE